jgi:MFS family permease
MGFQSRSSGWAVVAASVAALIVGQGSINVFAAGVFLKPVSEELGFGRGEISTAIGISNLMIALATPFFGRLIDKYGVQRPLLASIALFALATAAMSMITPSIAVLYGLYAIAGLVGVGQNPGAYSKAVSAWFDSRRGLALGITLAGVGLGTAIVPQLSSYLIGHFGWRLGYVGLGATIIVLALLPVALWVRLPDSSVGGSIAQRVTVGMTVREALRDWRFWALTVSFFIGGLVINGSLVHIVPLLTDRGVSLPAAVGAVSSAGLALIVGRLIAGYLMDKMHAPLLGIFFLILPLVGLVLLTVESVNPIIGAILLGLGIGAEVDLLSYLVSRYFGMKSFGTLHGLMFSGVVLGNAAGAASLGWAFQANGSYNAAFTVFEALLVVGCILFGILGAYRYPAQGQPQEGSVSTQPAIN